MQKRTLGNNGLEVSALGLGCMGLSFGYGQPAEKTEAVKLLRSAYEQGITFLIPPKPTDHTPTKNCWAKPLPFRSEIVIATRFGFKDGKPDLGMDLCVPKQSKRLRKQH
jgi:aryl-alcohol dehydrogenase-like predicted oxidoreductase